MDGIVLRLTSPFDPRLIPLEGRENSQGAFTGRKAWNSTGISYIPPVIYISFCSILGQPREYHSVVSHGRWRRAREKFGMDEKIWGRWRNCFGDVVSPVYLDAWFVDSTSNETILTFETHRELNRRIVFFYISNKSIIHWYGIKN